MAWHGSISLGASEGGRILVVYRGESRVYDLGDAATVEKLRRVGTLNHAAAMKFLSRFPRVPEAEKAHVAGLKSGTALEFKAVLESVKEANTAKTKEPAPPVPPTKKGKGR